MGTLERKEREKLEMRKTILKAATELFLKDGIEKLTLRAIATKIEYSVGTIYLYYKDKDELFHDLMEKGYQKLSREIQKIPPTDDHIEYLKQLARTYIHFGLKNPQYYDLMFIMEKPDQLSQDLSELGAGLKTFNALYDTIRTVVEKDLIRFKDVPTASMAIWGVEHGLVSLYNRNRLLMYTDQNVEEQLFASMDNFIDSIKK